MPSQSKNSKQITIARRRELQALELRKTGLSYAEIGKKLGISDVGALDAVRRGMDKLNKEILETAAEVQRLELERLDDLYKLSYKKAKAGNMTAIQRCISIMERRARLLGLDKPVQTENTVTMQVVGGIDDSEV